MASTKDSLSGRPAVQLGRALASPVGVLITVPLLVAVVGIGILILGRGATRTATKEMARSQLGEQVTKIQTDVAYALDQSGPLLAQLRTLADPSRTTEDVLVRLHDIMVARPGIAYLSLSFPDGMFRGAYLNVDQRRLEAQESRVGGGPNGGTDVHRFTVERDRLVPLLRETTDYDPRRREFYQLAVKNRARSWTTPYTFFKTHETGITCAEPLYGPDQTLVAVLTVDFDVAALSSFVARPGLEEARSIVYTGDGVILAYPAAETLALPRTDQPLRYEDLKDPALGALFAQRCTSARCFLELDTRDGMYFAAVAPIGGKRADVAVPLDWYAATLVPRRVLLGPVRARERSTAIASAVALMVAVGLALILAWNLIRMRRQVAASREEARSAQARAKELGSYRLVARLGAGGMGEVWRAEHRLLARSSAIKLIRPEALHDPGSVPEIRERFRREAQTLASMRSRHTIEIYDYGVTDGGIFYYVMELLDGLDLESLVVKYGAQPAARVIDLMIQACASLAEAHDAGLLHRDIKPPNLYLSRAADEVDIVKLLDFGIVQSPSDPAVDQARMLIDPAISDSKLTQAGAMLGTPGFMAPEQILGMKLDGRADLYALGCVAWWLLAGGELFPRTGADAKILHRHIYEPIPSLRQVVKGWCPRELEDVVAACLAKDADARPADARDLARRLRAIEIPAEHAWTMWDAADWWAAYSPPEPQPTVSTPNIQVIMPGRTEERPAMAAGDEAIGPTVAPPPRR